MNATSDEGDRGVDDQADADPNASPMSNPMFEKFDSPKIAAMIGS